MPSVIVAVIRFKFYICGNTMRMKKLLLLISAFAFIASCTYEKGEVPVIAAEEQCDSTISYADDIAPLMMNYCVGCHVSGGTGSGDFTDYTGVKQKVDNGSLKNRVLDV